MSILKRNSYKQVWDDLSDTYRKAVMNVTGDASEKQLQEFGLLDSKKIIEYTQMGPDDVVLEIGCGVGRLGYCLSDYCKQWIGCDISQNMISHAKKRLEQKSNVTFIELGDNNLHAISDNSVDIVYCSVVFMHLEEWDRFSYIEESYRILRKGGRLYIDNFTIESEDGWRIFKKHQEIPSLDRKPEISKSSNSLEFQTYLRQAGFSDFQTKILNEWLIGYARK